ncbi:helix-turn-helix domain-containing protein [Burkholderia vietnamiensis]|uniref:helix-turn-helix domain-containing protein n=1 Tax=Burkholderia vietnamiensis TaxID=60552 RepID=UPI0009BED92C|nr:helix-turn-helix domain-containing protein [Burkholderia vietnamiensis]
MVTFIQLQQEPNVTTKTIQTSPLLSSLLHEFLDDRALAVLLNISEKTPAQWRFTGKFSEELPFYKFGRCVRYRREDVEAFIEKSRVGGITISEGA